jgi:ubiquinone/menaquinone biosynthesis C-methylase UbiE
MYPCDEKEQDRLDIHFQMISVALDGKLHLAPIGKHPQRILELATGTGIWAITMGDQYPSAEIIGNELSPIQPKFVPPNVRFEIDDIEDEWLYQDKFDFIFARYLVGAIKDWPRLLRQAYE